MVLRFISFSILLALLVPPLRAVWERPGVAHIEHGVGCLYKGQTFIQCYDSPGVLTLGGKGPLDAAFRPMAGDIFRLVSPGGVVTRARLIGRVYLPVWR